MTFSEALDKADSEDDSLTKEEATGGEPPYGPFELLARGIQADVVFTLMVVAGINPFFAKVETWDKFIAEASGKGEA